MSDAPRPRTGRLGGIFVIVVVAGSAVGVIGWYVRVNRAGAPLDATGFDVGSVSPSRQELPASAGSSETGASSLSFVKGDKDIRVGNAPPPSAAPAKTGDKKADSRASFTEMARKHEGDVRAFAERMTRANPVLRQYGRDWMSHPDLKKLNDDYMRDHDPVAFILGLTRAPSLGGMVKKYAGSPAIVQFITEGMKQAPGELTSSAMDVLANDSVAKGLISNVANGLGLPPSVTAVINGGDASKIDQQKLMNDVMSSPALQNAVQQQGQAPAPVQLSR